MKPGERRPDEGEQVALLGDREIGRLRVVALEREGQAIRIVPESSAALAAGDLLIVIGEREALIRLAQAASSEGG